MTGKQPTNQLLTQSKQQLTLVLQLFEALTGESWTGNIWNSMKAVGPASCLFWIAWDVVGHKILLNLFLAILINNFQDQDVCLLRCAVLSCAVMLCLCRDSLFCT